MILCDTSNLFNLVRYCIPSKLYILLFDKSNSSRSGNYSIPSILVISLFDKSSFVTLNYCICICK